MPGQASVRGSRIVPLIVLAGASVALAWALYLLGEQPIVFDSEQYVRVARFLTIGRLEDWEQRTYGYPAFLAVALTLAWGDTVTLRWVVLAIQIGVYLGACWLFARRVAAAFGSARIAQVTLVLTALNPYALILSGIILTDLLSVALITVAAALLLPTRTSPVSPRGVLRDGVLALFTLALAAEIRPANAVLLPVGGLFWLARWWQATGAVRPRLLVSGCLLVGAAAAIPMVPQVLVNLTLYGQPSPFTTRSLYREQIAWGMANLKYATFAPPGFDGEPHLFYRSPFVAGQPSPGSYLVTRPHLLVGTFALHGFGLLDQDYPFVYIPTLDPWYRWPLSIVNYLLLWTMAVGLVLGFWCWWRSPDTRFAWSVLAGLGTSYLLLYLPTAVECRFGVPLFVLMAPAAALALVTVRDAIRAQRWRQVVGFGVGAALTVAGCAMLSVWMLAQAPNIPIIKEIAQLPQIDPPVARFDVLPPERWTIEQRQQYIVRVTNLGEQTWYTIRPARVFLHIMFVGPDDRDVVDTGVETRIPIDQPVPPGQQHEMRVTVSAPRKEGTYRLRQQLEIGEQAGPSGSPPQETHVVVNERRR
jgi:hypothetical protein